MPARNLFCSGCSKLVAVMNTGKIAKGVAHYCEDCNQARERSIERLSILMNMNVGGRNKDTEESFRNIFKDLWK